MKNLLILLTALLFCGTAYPAELFGTIDGLTGSASMSDASGASSNVAIGQKIFEGQTISTSADGEVHIVSEDGGIIAVRPDTVFRVDQYQGNGSDTDKVFMSLLKGAVRSITGWIGKHNPSSYQLTTPSATIGVRGTDHETTVIERANGSDEPGTYDTVTEGATVLRTPHGETAIEPGKFGYAQRGGAYAPRLLAQHPHFWAMRRLRLEGRLQERKAFLRSRLEEMRENRIRHPSALREKRMHRRAASREEIREHRRHYRKRRDEN